MKNPVVKSQTAFAINEPDLITKGIAYDEMTKNFFWKEGCKRNRAVVWKDPQSLENAKREVFAFYQKQKFDMPAFLKRLNVKIDRAIYRELKD